MLHNLIIIGSGPAGYSAAIYAQRASLNPLLISGLNVGGQLMETTDIENYPGSMGASGPELMEIMKKQVENLNVKILTDDVENVIKEDKVFIVTTNSNNTYKAKAVIVATGSSAKWLNVKGEDTFKGYGVSACATCDGFFFQDQIVAVVGGGNTAVEEAIYLSSIAKKVYLIHRKDVLRAEQIMQDKLFNIENIEAIWNKEVLEIVGNDNPKSLTHLILKDTKNSQEEKLEVNGLFVAIGHTPNTDFVKKIADLDDYNYIQTLNNGSKVLFKNSVMEGLFAAGDVKDSVYRQAITSAGSGCIAALDALQYLSKL